jgi:uncharacterized damage-inducible protein DinB
VSLDFADLVSYITRVHGRTLEAARALPDDRIDWRPRAGEFSAGELLTHIANSRLMNVGTIRGEGTRYRGHGVRPGATAQDLAALLLRTSKTTIARLSDADLEAEVRNLAGSAVPAWQILLGGLAEHEVHHRSQFCEYLAGMGIEPPALHGVHAEELPR